MNEENFAVINYFLRVNDSLYCVINDCHIEPCYFFGDISYDDELDNFDFNKLYYRLLDIKKKNLLIKADDIVNKCILVRETFLTDFLFENEHD